MLEFCDRGNLQDAVDRGVFTAKRADPDAEGPPPRNLPAVVYAPAALAYGAGTEVFCGGAIGLRHPHCQGARHAWHAFACRRALP